MVSVVSVAGICNLVDVGVFLDTPPQWRCRWQISVGFKARVVNPKHVKQVVVPAVLECANCSLHGTVGGALSETVATVSLSYST